MRNPRIPVAGTGDTLAANCILCGNTPHAVFLDQLGDRLGVAQGPFRYVRCSDCGLISLLPIPDGPTVSSFYPPTFWRTEEQDGSPALMKRIEGWYRDRLLAADFRFLEPLIKPGTLHLDVGCATGDLIRVAQSRGAHSKGIEFSESAVRFAVEHLGLDVVQGDFPDHDFGENVFDVITYNAVLEHVPDPLRHLRACRRALKSGGTLAVLGLPNIDSFGYRLTGRHWLGLDCPRHLYHFSKGSLDRLLDAAGFRAVTWNTRSPRFNRSTLIASLFPTLQRHAFDQYEARTGKNPLARKVALFALLQVAIPVDWVVTGLGLGEYINCMAVPK